MDDARLKLAELSYREVLDATKHQDDKIGRFITAVAFLTTGAIALGSRTEVIQLRYRIGTTNLPLPAFLLATFIIFALLSLLFVLYSLAGRLRVPGVSTSERGPEAQHSRLFFLVIKRNQLTEWQERWSDSVTSSTLHEELYRDMVDETHNLAIRAAFKYNRSSEAAFCLVIALLALSLAVVLGFVGLRSTSTGAGPVSWSWTARSVVASTLGLFTFVLAYLRQRWCAEDPAVETKDIKKRESAFWKWTSFLGPLTVAVSLLSPSGIWRRGFAISALPFVLFLLCELYGWVMHQWKKRFKLSAILAGVAFSVTLFLVIQNNWSLWRLVLAGLLPVLVSLPVARGTNR